MLHVQVVAEVYTTAEAVAVVLVATATVLLASTEPLMVISGVLTLAATGSIAKVGGVVLVGLVPPWQHEPPVWELRVDEYRVFYDVDQEGSRVTVRAIRHKPPHTTTEEIL